MNVNFSVFIDKILSGGIGYIATWNLILTLL